jgi:hypothetical protein
LLSDCCAAFLSSLRFARHVIVCVRLCYAPKTKSLVKAIRFVVLQPYSEENPLPPGVSLIDGISQNACSNPAILMARLDLNFADFYGVWLIERLNHADSCAVYLDN